MSNIDVACLVCDDVRKEDNGKHLYIGVYSDSIVFRESVWKENGQVTLSKLVIANIISGVEPGTRHLTRFFEDPDGEPFGPKEPQSDEVSFIDELAQAIHIVLMPVVFKKLGQYKFRMEIDGELICDKTFEVSTRAETHLRVVA